MSQEPSAALLKLLRLMSKQLKTVLALREKGEGMTREALQAMYDLSDEEFVELIERYFLKQTGNHYHASSVGGFIAKTAIDLDQATPGD